MLNGSIALFFLGSIAEKKDWKKKDWSLSKRTKRKKGDKRRAKIEDVWGQNDLPPPSWAKYSLGATFSLCFFSIREKDWKKKIEKKMENILVEEEKTRKRGGKGGANRGFGGEKIYHHLREQWGEWGIVCSLFSVDSLKSKKRRTRLLNRRKWEREEIKKEIMDDS